MKTKKVMGTSAMTFHDGCEAYLLNCRQRNLREATIKHYQQSYTQFYKQIAPDMPLKDFDCSSLRSVGSTMACDSWSRVH